MHYFYGDQICIALGWAVANIFFNEVFENFGCFPILFMHGDSGKGKTKLGTLILAMFGIRHPEGDKMFHNKLEEMSHIAGSRLKDNIFSMPTLFDEYNARHYHLLKALYDGSGRVTAIKDQTNRVRRSEVRGGTMTAALIRPHEKEILNRCIYYDIAKSVDPDKSAEFDKEFTIDYAYRDLSNLAISIAINDLSEKYMTYLNQAKSHLLENAVKSNEAIGRITTNYAIAFAGYRLLYETGVIPQWNTINNWVEWVDETVMAIKESDPVEAFLFVCKKFAMQGMFRQYLEMEIDSQNKPVLNTNVNGQTTIRLYINLQYIVDEVQQYCRQKQVFHDLLGMTAGDFKAKIKRSLYFSGTKRKTFYANDMYNSVPNNTCTALVVDVPEDWDDSDDNQDEVPF
jgi:hypothetical protein